MAPPDRFAEPFFRGKGAQERADDTEAELALLLQNSPPGDPRVFDLLVERYGAELARFIRAMLGQGSGASRAEVAWIAGETLAAAVAELDQFKGEATVAAWLYGLALRAMRKRLVRGRAPWAGSRPAVPARSSLSASDEGETQEERLLPGEAQPSVPWGELWAALDRMEAGARRAVVLRYLLDLPVPEIGRLLRLRERQIRSALAAARRQALILLLTAQSEAQPPHPETGRQVQEALDGLLSAPGEQEAGETGLHAHLAECPGCQVFAEQLHEAEKSLREALADRWPLQALEEQELDWLKAAAGNAREGGGLLEWLQPRFSRAAWVGLSLLAILGLAWSLFRAGLLGEENPPRPSPTATAIPLPDPLPLPAAALQKPALQETLIQIEVVHNTEPDLSTGGRWLVFSTSADFDGQSSRPNVILLALFDRESGEIELLSLPGLSGAWVMEPHISEDGRWIVFMTTEPISPAEDLGWRTSIYLYDRVEGILERVDRAPDGAPADDDSVFPAISADGRWIAYWSAAGNLVPGDGEPCGLGATPEDCADLFIFDRETGKTTRIPIGRGLDQLSEVESRLSLSRDGRWLALTLLENDRAARSAGMTGIGAYLYDRQSGVFQPVNPEGAGGTQTPVSFYPSLSADGSAVAFLARSEEVGRGSDQATMEVYVRSLPDGEPEQVSGGLPGVHAFDYGWGNNPALSGNGRYLVFLSPGRETVPGRAIACSGPAEEGCNAVYLHDRLTGQTVLVAAPQPGRHYLFPSISETGRWVSYMEAVVNCLENDYQHVCSEVWLYDRQTGRTRPVTKGMYRQPEFPFEVSTTARARSEPVTSLAYSSDGAWLASGYAGGDLLLWPASGDEDLVDLQVSSGSAASLAFSPGGDWLAAGTNAGNVEIWRMQDFQRSFILEDHPGLSGLAFANQGQRLVVTAPWKVWIWQLQGSQFIRIHTLDYPVSAADFALSPSGDLLAVAAGDGTVWLQSIPAGEVPLRLGGRPAGVASVAFSPDGRVLAAGWRDGAVDLWDITRQEGGLLFASYRATLWQPEYPWRLAFSQSGDRLASGSVRGDLRVWGLPGGQILETLQTYQMDLRLNGFFAFQGEQLAAGTAEGALYLLKGRQGVARPRFFSWAEAATVQSNETYPPFLNDERGLADFQGNVSGGVLNLSQAAGLAPFNLEAPTYLPPRFQFHQAYLTRDGAAVFEYARAPESQAGDRLYLLQYREGAGPPPFAVGPGAFIEGLDFSNDRAEYLRGDWVPLAAGEAGAGAGWSWDPQAPVQRLRWESHLIRYALLYRALGQAEEPFPLERADLLAIAASLANPEETNPLGPAILSHTVRPGETFWQIAAAYGARLDRLEQWNGASDNPDLIVPGQVLLVPVEEPPQPIAEIDLNCDGRAERLSALPFPPAGAGEVVGLDIPAGQGEPLMALFLETPGRYGFYQEAWRYTISQAGDRAFSAAQLLRVGPCLRFLSLQVYPGEADGLDPLTEIYRWVGTGMERVLQAAGTAPNGRWWIDRTRLSIDRLAPDPASGACLRITTVYAWNGDSYVEMDRAEEPGVGCPGD